MNYGQLTGRSNFIEKYTAVWRIQSVKKVVKKGKGEDD